MNCQTESISQEISNSSKSVSLDVFDSHFYVGGHPQLKRLVEKLTTKTTVGFTGDSL